MGFKKKDEEIKNLKKEIENLKQEKTELGKRCIDLHNEVNQLHEALTELENALEKLSRYDTENKKLSKEKEEIHMELLETKKGFENERTKLRNELLLLQKNHEEEIQKIMKDAEKNKEEHLMKSIKLKEKQLMICELEDAVKNFDARLAEEKLKMKIQYEEKIEVLHQEISKNKQAQQVPGTYEDIFRRKCQRLEAQHKSEIEALQGELKALKAKYESSEPANQSTYFDMYFSKENDRIKPKQLDLTQVATLRPTAVARPNVKNPVPQPDRFLAPKKRKDEGHTEKSLAEGEAHVANGNNPPKKTVPIKRKKLFNSQLNISFINEPTNK